MRFAASLLSLPYCYAAAEEAEIATKASNSQRSADPKLVEE